jgi:gamma-glutamylaminecyclotransferase
MPKEHRVFVYGTLKEGFPNEKANAGHRVSGEFLTKARYPLYLVGPRYSPWLVAQENRGFRVSGQVFVVDDAALRNLDRLERVDRPDGYRRMAIVVIHRETGAEQGVFAYLKPAALLESADIRSGPLRSYEPEHSALYRPRRPRP